MNVLSRNVLSRRFRHWLKRWYIIYAAEVRPVYPESEELLASYRSNWLGHIHVYIGQVYIYLFVARRWKLRLRKTWTWVKFSDPKFSTPEDLFSSPIFSSGKLFEKKEEAIADAAQTVAAWLADDALCSSISQRSRLTSVSDTAIKACPELAAIAKAFKVVPK